MNINSVKIRMYRHGFGDCFLLQYFAGKSRKFTMLIDCGLKLHDKVEGVALKNVVDDIKTELKGSKNSRRKPTLDVLVVTHEHWDHVSGFHPNEGLFDDFNIGRIWMAWTENPEDDEAIIIRKHLKKSVKALKIASAKVKRSKSAAPNFFVMNVNGDELKKGQKKFVETLQKVTEFFGPLGLDTPSGMKLQDKYKISIDTQIAMERVKSLASGQSGINYYYPGELIQNLANLPGVRVYVLGPPKGALLNKDKPSSGAKKEVYFGLDDSAMIGFVNGLLAAGDNDGEFDDDGRPFNDVIAFDEDQAMKDKYIADNYFKAENQWREIGEEWLNMAGPLAMQLDSDTNNTSLALAIEFVRSGKVLLFPGDAQVGNWLSWHHHEWEVRNGDNKEKVTAPQLLQNTVFYKAGHHLSHNATLSKLGLDLMTSDELVAFIPEKQDQYNGIPYEPLIKQIRTKTRGRFIFSADSNYPAEDILTKKPKELSKAEWDQFKNSLEITKMYIEYTVKV